MARRAEPIVLALLGLPTAFIDWEIAQTWHLPLWISLLAGAVAIVALGMVVLSQRWAAVGTPVMVAVLYGLPVLGGILRWRLVPSPTLLIGDGAFQIQAARDVLLRGIDPYGFNYVGTGMERTPWSQPFANPSLHHLDYWPGTILVPLPLQAAFKAITGWWDERIWLLLTAVAIWIILTRLAPGPVGRTAAAAFFLIPGHSLLAILGDNDLTMVAWLLAAVVAMVQRRWFLSAVLLGVALATKQTAFVVLPILIIFAVSLGIDRRRFLQCAGIAGVVLAACIAPFAIWDGQTFLSDTILFNFGSGSEAYPIQGIGLSQILLNAGVIHGARDAFPFLLIQLPLVLAAWFLAWRWLDGHRRAGDVILWIGIAFFVFLFTNRFTQQTYLVLGIELILAGLLLRLDNRPGVSLAALRPRRLGSWVRSLPWHVDGDAAQPPQSAVG